MNVALVDKKTLVVKEVRLAVTRAQILGPMTRLWDAAMQEYWDQHHLVDVEDGQVEVGNLYDPDTGRFAPSQEQAAAADAAQRNAVDEQNRVVELEALAAGSSQLSPSAALALLARVVLGLKDGRPR